jgi:hypothetical protein
MTAVAKTTRSELSAWTKLPKVWACSHYTGTLLNAVPPRGQSGAAFQSCTAVACPCKVVEDGDQMEVL